MTKRSIEYDQFIKPIEDQMIRSVWRLIRDGDDADDVFQEALLKIWKRWNRICKHPNPHALILRICINAAYDHLRRNERMQKHDPLDSVSATLSDSSPLAWEEMEHEDKKSLIFRAIGALPKHQRLAVHMRYIEETSYPAIAQALGCGEATVRKHVSRAISKLRVVLSESSF
ncbi:MAG: RNA polymerase sigma factor [Candidatus Zhuqueibacterota bacterium]